MSTSARPLRAWLVVLAVTAVASLLFSALQLPSPVLFGSLVGGMVHALTARDGLDLPAPLFRVGQALVGAVIGALVQLSTLARLAFDWPSVLLVTVGTLAISVAAGWLMGLHRDVSTATGAFSLVAGGVPPRSSRWPRTSALTSAWSPSCSTCGCCSCCWRCRWSPR